MNEMQYSSRCYHYLKKICTWLAMMMPYILIIAILVWKLAMFMGWASDGQFLSSLWYCLAGISCVLLWYCWDNKGNKKINWLKRLLTIVMWILVTCAFIHVHGEKAVDFFNGKWFRNWTVFHYYLGAKYFDELSYDGLYEQTIVADNEGPQRLKEVKFIRNLQSSYEPEPISNFKLKRSPNFSDARWEEFKKDVNYFTGLKKVSFFQQMLCDRGYNPSPFWTFICGTLTNSLDITVPAEKAALLWIDLIIGLIALLICIYAFGPAPTAIMFLIFVLSPVNFKRLYGGILTYDWFCAMLMGLAFFHKKKPYFSAVCWSYAVMSRVFPLIFVFGLLGAAICNYFKTHKFESINRRFFIAFIIFCLCNFTLGCFNTHGLKSWEMFTSKIIKHQKNQVWSSRRVGMEHLFTQEIGSFKAPSNGSQVHKNFIEQKTFLNITKLLMVCGIVLIVYKKRDTDAMLWMLPVFFALSVGSRYYWAIMAYLALLKIWDEKRRPSLAGSLLAFGVISGWYIYAHGEPNPYLQFVRMNALLTCGFFCWITAEMFVDLFCNKVKERTSNLALYGNEIKHDKWGLLSYRKYIYPTITIFYLFLTVVYTRVFFCGEKQQPLNSALTVESSHMPVYLESDSVLESSVSDIGDLSKKSIGEDIYFQNMQSIGTYSLNKDMIGDSIKVGRKFLLNNQKPDGNFTYEYNFLTGLETKGDNQVRQAGALWGITLIHNFSPSKETLLAIEKGLDFFDKRSVETRNGRKYIVYPGEQKGKTGAVALVVLTLVDFLRTENNEEYQNKYQQDIKMYTKFLLSLRMENGEFYKYYDPDNGKGLSSSSPYFDGEVLLALIKATKYANYSDWGLKKTIFESAEAMYDSHVVQALKINKDSLETKGFYQWGSMAYYELYTSGWDGCEKYANRTLALADWMIDEHCILKRTKNTAYAYEGLISAWELAKLTGNNYALDKIGYVIDNGLRKLISWQIAGPLENKFLKLLKINDSQAVGGIMNGKADPMLRIDVTQHQMHAEILACRFIYKNNF